MNEINTINLVRKDANEDGVFTSTMDIENRRMLLSTIIRESSGNTSVAYASLSVSDVKALITQLTEFLNLCDAPEPDDKNSRLVITPDLSYVVDDETTIVSYCETLDPIRTVTIFNPFNKTTPQLIRTTAGNIVKHRDRFNILLGAIFNDHGNNILFTRTNEDITKDIL